MSNHPRRGHRHHPVTKAVGASGTILTLGAALVAVTPGTAGAAPILVDSAADDGGGSATTLREAIEQANGTTAADVISFAPTLNGQTITLDGSQLEITEALDIQGPGADLLTVDGDDGTRVFYIRDEDIDVTIAGLTITGGSTGGNGGGIYSGTEGALTLTNLHVTGNYAEFGGGGLYAAGGSVTITGSTFDHNEAGQMGGGARLANLDGPISITGSTFDHNRADSYGGAVSIYDSPDADTTISGSTFSTNYAYRGAGISHYTSGTLDITDTTIVGNEASDRAGGLRTLNSGAVTITRSTISGNYTAGDGGGIYAYNLDGPLTIENSTISGNEAGGDGGGIKFVGVDSGDAEMVLTHDTITENIAAEGEGGGVRMAEHATIDHTIIAGNTGGDAIGNDGAAADLSNSLIGEAEADLAGITVTDGGNNAFSTDPMLGPLASNGGPTDTHALLAGSPAINSGDPAFTPPPETDQRGEARVADVVIDKGAYEAQVDEEEPRGEPPAAQPVDQSPSFTG